MGLIFTYILTFGGALGALFNPFIGVCVYVCLAVLKPTEIWWYSVPDGPYSQIVAIAMLVGWTFKKFGSWQFYNARPLLTLFALFVVWSALSTAVAASHKEIGWFFVTTIIKFFIPFLVGLTLIDSEKRIRILFWVILVSMGYWAYEQNLYYLTQGRVIGGTFVNGVAHEMALGVGLAVFMGLYMEKNWQKWFCWICAAMMVHVTLFQESRGAMVGLLFTGAYIVYFMPKTKTTISLSIIAVIGVLAITGQEITEEFLSIFAEEGDRDGSAQSRIDLWADMLYVAVTNPIFGIGPGHWPFISHEFGWRDGKQGHGLWVQYLAEVGFVGGILIFSFFALCAHRLTRIASSLKGEPCWLLGPMLGVSASLFCWIPEAQFGSFWMMELPYYLVLLGAASIRVYNESILPGTGQNNSLTVRGRE